MGNTAPTLKLRLFAAKGHTYSRQKGEIVTQKHPRALPGAFAHRAAEAAIGGLVILVFSHAQLIALDLDVTEHPCHLPFILPQYFEAYMSVA